MKKNKDYYKVLGLSPTASSQEIKEAYRQLVKQYHPDYNQGSDVANAMLKMINEAYDVLSDLSKRDDYDRLLNKNSWMNWGSSFPRAKRNNNYEESDVLLEDILKKTQAEYWF